MTSAAIGIEIPPAMAAVLLLGHGGLEQLQYRDDVATLRLVMARS